MNSEIKYIELKVFAPLFDVDPAVTWDSIYTASIKFLKCRSDLQLKINLGNCCNIPLELQGLEILILIQLIACCYVVNHAARRN